MDLVFSQGTKFSYLLIPRTSKFFSTFLYRHHKFTTYWHTQYLRIHLASSCQPNYLNVFTNRYEKQKYNQFSRKFLFSQYGTSTKSDSSTKSAVSDKQCSDSPVVNKPSVFQRMKQLTKDYWHILIPVHIVTSIGWASMFYTAAKNGVDIVGILESLHLSEKYLELLRGSNAGHWAVTYALYKIFSPLRYTVTVGGTTMCIRYLNKWGYLKRKKNANLTESAKSAEQHTTTCEKANISSKIKQPESPKT